MHGGDRGSSPDLRDGPAEGELQPLSDVPATLQRAPSSASYDIAAATEQGTAHTDAPRRGEHRSPNTRRAARPLLPPTVDPPSRDADAHDDRLGHELSTPLPSFDTLDALSPAALPAFLADIAGRQTYLAALQVRAAARLASAPAAAGAAESRIAPGQRLNAKQLAARMGRSVDYIYRHARRWPFTVRDGRSVAFDEAGYLRWEKAKQRGALH